MHNNKIVVVHKSNGEIVLFPLSCLEQEIEERDSTGLIGELISLLESSANDGVYFFG